MVFFRPIKLPSGSVRLPARKMKHGNVIDIRAVGQERGTDTSIIATFYKAMTNGML